MKPSEASDVCRDVPAALQQMAVCNGVWRGVKQIGNDTERSYGTLACP